MENYCFLEETPVGRLCITEAEGCITGVTWGEPPADAVWEETPLLQSCKEELRSFFRGEKKTFDLPLYCRGTAFQQQVWAALREIPYGETRTYGEIAAAIGRPKAARAVGMANHRNPIAILIPCHRVIGVKGKLTGYAGGIEKRNGCCNWSSSIKIFERTENIENDRRYLACMGKPIVFLFSIR